MTGVALFLLALAFALLSARWRARGRRGPLASRWATPAFALLVAAAPGAFGGAFSLLPLTTAALAFLPREDADAPDAGARRGGSPWLPLACGLASAAATWWVWGAWDPIPYVHDESAYLLQAGTFAQGRWADPPPPLPGFFDEVHVLSTPARAAKYPPGHALVLLPGVAAGVPAAVPSALAGLSAALLVILARRAAGPGVALLTWLVWLGSSGGLRFRSAYFSEATSGVLWLLGWWALERWIATAKARWLVALSVCGAWMALTRPLTAIAFAIPAAVVVLRRVAARRAWSQAGLATLAGATVLLVWPLWVARTTGGLGESPMTRYTRDFLPFDRPGFGLDETPSRLPAPACLPESFAQSYRVVHARHTVARLPEIASLRLLAVTGDVWGGWRFPLFACALLGFFVAPREARVPLVSAAAQIALYLSYAHFPTWTLYYLEFFPVLAFVTAVGARTAWRRIALGRPGIFRLGAVAAMLLIAFLAGRDAARQRGRNRKHFEPQTAFRALVRSVPGPAVVFVGHDPGHDPNRSFVRNGPDLAHAKVWVAFDRGPENAELCRSAPERTPYLYDEASGRLLRLGPGCGAPVS